MSTDPSVSAPLISEFADDPDMLELVEMFVGELPQRVADIEQAVDKSDMATLARLSHQLKGSAGGYGFMPITDAAGDVEKLVKADKQLQEIEGSIAELLTLCRRASSQPKA